MTTELKAYVVSNDDDDNCVVVFAKHRATAQSQGANELDMEFAAVSCRRAPKFDGLQNDPRALKRAQLRAGWWFDSGYGRFDSYDAPWVSMRGEVYRSPWHWLAEREKAILERAAAMAAERSMRERLLAEFWYADSIDVHSSFGGKNVYASVDLPHMRYPLRVAIEDGKPERWTIALADQAAWQSVGVVNADCRA